MINEKTAWIIGIILALLVLNAPEPTEASDKKEGLESIISAPAGVAMLAAGGAATTTGVGASFGVPLMIIGGILLLFAILTGVGIANVMSAITGSPLLWVLLAVGLIMLLKNLKK